ncbi:MAG: GGDEF domain-containing protein [Thermoguttaceae bacterium]
MLLQLCFLSISNIGAGFVLGTALGRRYRKLETRRMWASLAATLPPVVPGPAPAPARPAAAPAPVQPLAAPVAPATPQPKSPSHLAVDDLHDRVANFGMKLIEADEQLRQCAASPDLGTIESVLSGIENTARNYVESRESAQQKLANLTHDAGEWEGIRNDLVVAAQMQDAEIKATCQEIANFNYETDLPGGCQKIVGNTHRLLNSNDMLRDALQKALAEVAQQESRPPEQSDRSDPLTGCVNRAGIEADLNTWWASVPDHTRLCVAMIDIDRLSQANEQFGYRAGNEIIKAIARLLEASRADNVQVARFSGQRFLAMFSDVELATATNTIERFRQTIESAHFERKDFDIRITVSCALTRANSDDSPSSVLLRAESALREAKRYGHNRTFVHEGKYPTPVVPPDIQIEPLHLPI